jgi:hypothetical protein
MTPNNIAFVQQWIAALRSGEYSQIAGVHKIGRSYCALGLGYSLCPGHRWISLGSDLAEQAADRHVVPRLLISMTGLPEEQLGYIARLNDYQDWSFLLIADYLESLLPEKNFAQDLYNHVKALPPLPASVHDAILLAADHIEQYPEEFNFHQSDIPSGKHCGSPGCALGWIATFSGGIEAHASIASAAEAMGTNDWDFYARMDELVGEEWSDEPALCAQGLRLYAQKYHAPQKVAEVA